MAQRWQMARLKFVGGQMKRQKVPFPVYDFLVSSPRCQSSFLSETLSSCGSLELVWPVNSRSPGLASWMAWYLCSSRYVVKSLAYSGWVMAKASNSPGKQSPGETVGRSGGQVWRWNTCLLTEGDETRSVSVDFLEKLGHVYVWHAQGRTQQGCKLLSGDAFILVRVEQLQERGKTRGCRWLDGLTKGYNNKGFNKLSQTGGEKNSPFHSFYKNNRAVIPKTTFDLPTTKRRTQQMHIVKMRSVYEYCLCSVLPVSAVPPALGDVTEFEYWN